MKKVIFIEQPKEETKKPVEFTHCLQSESNMFYKSNYTTEHYCEILYLGKHDVSRGVVLDFFRASNKKGDTHFFLGHLNSGEY